MYEIAVNLFFRRLFYVYIIRQNTPDKRADFAVCRQTVLLVFKKIGLYEFAKIGYCLSSDFI
jgi:hypothetical protein